MVTSDEPPTGGAGPSGAWRRGLQLIWAVSLRLVPRPPGVAAGLLFIGAVVAALAGVSSIAVDTVALSVLIGALAAAPVVVEEWVGRRRDARHAAAVEAAANAVAQPESAPPARPLARPVPSLTQTYTFRGRESELARLIEIHDGQRQRDGAEPRADNRPVVLSVHGMPGVGKSELVKELAVRLASHYADGTVLASFNQAAVARPAADLIREFLRRLGWPEADMPADADAHSTLRSFTSGKKIIFIFDAARNADQVKAVMPTEPGCAVFITSRQDLSGGLAIQPAWASGLGVPSPEDAVHMLAEHGDADWLADAVSATDVVGLCGRLPMAIKSVAERMAHDGTPLRNVAARLSPRPTRLAKLSQPGRGVIEGVETEFARLSPTEQDALCLLSLVRSRVFIPWVLRPLLNIDEATAENVMLELGRAQLLQPAGHDDATGLARYEFNPLVRLFAEAELARRRTTRAPWAETAQTELDNGYLEFASAVLIGMGDGYRTTRPWRWVAGPGAAHQRLAASPERSIRLEYHNLVRIVQIAYEQKDYETCWRIAARLEGSVPEDFDLAASTKAFEDGIDAATKAEHPMGAIDVRLSHACLRVALEDYPTVLAELNVLSGLLTESGDDSPARCRLARVHRIRATAYLQIGQYCLARPELAAATALSDSVPPDEVQLVALLQAECDRVPGPGFDGSVPMGDSVFFRARLDDAESDRLGGRWSEARKALSAALEHSAGDLRRSADVYYRFGRLCIDQRQSQPEPRFTSTRGTDSPHRLARQAVSFAAQAVLAFRQMGNPIGVLRAQCLHIRALVAAGKLVEAELLCATVDRELNQLDLEAAARRPLEARFRRARGERMMQDDATIEAGRQDLKEAALIFSELEDWYSQNEVGRLLRR
jgi:hypothetical protein